MYFVYSIVYLLTQNNGNACSLLLMDTSYMGLQKKSVQRLSRVNGFPLFTAAAQALVNLKRDIADSVIQSVEPKSPKMINVI